MNTDMNLRARLYIGVMVGLGMWAMSRGAMSWYSHDIARLLCNVAVCALVSGLKVRLPGIEGTMSRLKQRGQRASPGCTSIGTLTFKPEVYQTTGRFSAKCP